MKAAKLLVACGLALVVMENAIPGWTLGVLVTLAGLWALGALDRYLKRS